MKSKIFKRIIPVIILLVCVSCETPDGEKPWGNSIIYMPQANYMPYIVPSGVAVQGNQNFKGTADKVQIFLGVYRSGLAELLSYSVDVTPESIVTVPGTTALPVSAYSVPSNVVCPNGKRDVTFYLEVNRAFLAADSVTNYSMKVTISNPSKYELNEELVSTNIHIKTKELLKALSTP